MKTCFVAQPFSMPTYEKRYHDTYEKAIRAANLDPYRVDRDASASYPILKIEEGIRESAVFFVEISEDNPNVWLEFGLAHAFKKEMVIVCEESRREKFPFDMQHRRVIVYKSESESDFVELKSKLIDAFSSALERDGRSEFIQTKIRASKDKNLSEFDIGLLISIANNVDGYDEYVARYIASNDMEKLGYNRLAANLAARKLTELEFIKEGQTIDFNGDNYKAYSVTNKGWNWFLSNPDLKKYIFKNDESKTLNSTNSPSLDDDIPF